MQSQIKSGKAEKGSYRRQAPQQLEAVHHIESEVGTTKIAQLVELSIYHMINQSEMDTSNQVPNIRILRVILQARLFRHFFETYQILQGCSVHRLVDIQILSLFSAGDFSRQIHITPLTLLRFHMLFQPHFGIIVFTRLAFWIKFLWCHNRIFLSYCHWKFFEFLYIFVIF